MSLFLPAQRITVYASRNVDPTELTVLAGSGAVHADQFKVATTNKLAGWKPYLHEVKIKRGAVDLQECKTTVPQCDFTLRDQRLIEGGDNLHRWWTGLMGATGGLGKFQQSGCRVVVEECEDWNEATGIGTWVVSFTGRISLANVTGLLVKITAQGMTKELVRAPIFTERPHASITYVAEPLLLPLGHTGAYGNLPEAPILHGTMGIDGADIITLDADSIHHPYNMLTSALVAHLEPGTWARPVLGDDGARPLVRLKSGATVYDFRLQWIKATQRDDHSHYAAVFFSLQPLDPAEPNYHALPGVGTVWEVSVLRPKCPPSSATPLLINAIQGPQWWSDALDGYFGPLLKNGQVDVQRRWAKNAAVFATFIADPSFPALRFPVKGPDKLLAWGQANVSKLSRIALAEDNLGQLTLLDLRLPNTLAGIPTLDDADLVADPAPAWEHKADDAVQFLQVDSYSDDVTFAEDLRSLPGPFPDLPAGLLTSTKTSTVEADFSAGGGGKTVTIDAQGFRSTPAEVSAAAAIHQVDRVIGQVLALMADFRKPYAAGPQQITATCRRTTKTKATLPGDLRLIQFSKIPDASSNLRGGIRLVRVLDKSEEKGRFTFTMLDVGPGVVCTVPVIGALGAGADAAHEITVPITVNANGDPVAVRVAYTDPAVGVIPADTSPLWTQVGGLYSTSQTVTIRTGIPGKRAWVQIRSEPLQTTRKAALASPWVVGAPAYRDLGALTPFTSVAISNVTSKAALVTINLGANTTDFVRILIASAASHAAADAATPVRLVDLLPGTTSFQLSGLDAAGANWWHHVQAQPFDGRVGVGAPVGSAPTSFQATGTPVKWPKIAGVLPLGGTTIISAVKSFDRQQQIVRTGNGFIILPGMLGLDIKVQRAPDVAGVAGAFADRDRIYAAVVQREGTAWSDPLPMGTPYWYRFCESGDGGDDSDWSEPIKAYPGVLANDALLAKSPGPIAVTRPLAGSARSVVQLQTWLWPNAEMDLWEADGSTPAGNALDLTGGATVTRLATPNSGDYALRYTNPDNATNGGWHGFSTLDPVKGAYCMPLRPGVRYRILIACKADSIANGERFRVTLDFGAGGTLTKTFVFKDLGHSAGAYGALFEFPLIVPSGADPNTKGTVEFNRNTSGATVNFDMDSIRVDEETADYELLSQQIQDQGYVVSINGDFERGRAFWEEAKATTSTTTLSFDPTTVDKGTQSLKITVSVSNTQTLLRQSTRDSDEQVTVLDTDPSTTRVVRVRQGDRIHVRGSVQASSGVTGVVPSLGVRYWSGTTPAGAGTGVLVCGGSSACIGSFEQIFGIWVVPAGVSWVAPYIQIDSQGAGVTVWLDDLVWGRLLMPPTAKVYNQTGTNVNLPNIADTQITFASEEWDDGAIHNTGGVTSRLTINGTKQGEWRLTGQVNFAAAAGGYRRVRIVKNGAVEVAAQMVPSIGATEMAVQVTAVIKDPAAGDYYELYAFQNSGGAINALGGHDAGPPIVPTKTWFSITHQR